MNEKDQWYSATLCHVINGRLIILKRTTSVVSSAITLGVHVLC